MNNTHNQPFKIAILTKDASFHREVVRGLYNKMEEFPLYTECHLYTISCGASWEQAFSSLDSIVKKKPVLIVSVGALCSQAARYFLNKHKNRTPLLFAGVTLPKQLGLIPTKKFLTTQAVSVSAFLLIS